MKLSFLFSFVALVWLAPARGEDPKAKQEDPKQAKPTEVNYEDWLNKDKPEFKAKYDGKFVKFMGVSDWKVEGKDEGKPRFHLVRLFYVPQPKGEETKKKEIAKAEVQAYITGNLGQAESELKKYEKGKWKCEFLVEGVMKVGENIVIENANLTYIHRVPKGKQP